MFVHHNDVDAFIVNGLATATPTATEYTPTTTPTPTATLLPSATATFTPTHTGVPTSTSAPLPPEPAPQTLTGAQYTYDGDGTLMRGTLNGTTTFYPGRHYNKEIAPGGVKVQKFYFAGAVTIAVRTLGDGTDVLHWVLSDHLGSTSTTANADGTLHSVIQYTAFGEIRSTQGTTPTQYRYTGQLAQAELGLDYYIARFYDPLTGHFTQADTLIPEPGKASAFDRYAYSNNKPINYNDPGGHFAWAPILIGIAGAVAIGSTVAWVNHQMNINKDPVLNREVRDQIGGKLVTQLSEVVNSAAKEHNVSSSTINAIIRHESGAIERRIFGNGRMADAVEYGQAMISSFGDRKASIGIGQMQIGEAKKLENRGYVSIPGKHDIPASLLNPTTSVEYIAGEVSYISDTLTQRYGNDFSNLSNDDQQRLILNSYNRGVEYIMRIVDESDIRKGIEVENYNKDTLDEYRRWKRENGFLDEEDER